jgi:hypothetical protein
VNKTGAANSSKRTGAAAEDGHERDHDEDEAMEGEDEDETLEEGDRDSGDVIGARKRRSPGDDDDDQGDDETGAAGGSSGTNAHGGSNGQTRGSGGMGGRKHMKRKSNSDLSNGGTTKKLRDTTAKGALVHSPDAKSTMSMSDQVHGGTSKFGTNGSIKVEDGAAAAAAADSDTEIEYLPMEDDPECPHMFGIDESDKEKDSSSEDEADEEEEDLVKTEGETGRATAAPSSKKSNGGQKGKESTEVQDDIQEKGRAWIRRLAMPESAWVSCW